MAGPKVSAEKKEQAKSLRELAKCCEEEANKLESGTVGDHDPGTAQGWEVLVMPLIQALLQYFLNRSK